MKTCKLLASIGAGSTAAIVVKRSESESEIIFCQNMWKHLLLVLNIAAN